MKRTKILLVEDDTSLGFLLVDYLESNGFDVKLYRDGESGIKGYRASNFDFCIFDIMLPGVDGFSLAKRIRAENKSIPIIFLTAKSMKQDKMKGFDIGVDDYITKPFDEDELLCRINAIITRYNIQPENNPSQEIYTFGDFSFDYKNLLLKSKKYKKRLTQKESDVLRSLCMKTNELITRDSIMTSIWGNSDYFVGRSLDVFIAKLRKYLNEDPSISIENIPKVGYILKTHKKSPD